MIKTSRCLYNNSFEEFCQENNEAILGTICQNYHGEIGTKTRDSWEEEIILLKDIVSICRMSRGTIIFEYDIPRLGKRIDAVLLYRGIIFCLEFKVHEKELSESFVDQVLDYALDLNNFHKYSQNKVIIPILIGKKV
jgi:hypothetical protein